MADPNSSGPETQFLYACITDAQATIRSLDGKVGVLLVGLAVPLTKLPAIVSVCIALLHMEPQPIRYLWWTFIIGLIVTWFGAFLTALKTLAPVNAAHQFVGGSKPPGRFFSGDAFHFSFVDAITSPNAQSAAVQFDRFRDSLPVKPDAIRDELAFEMLKLVFIRSIKAARAKLLYQLYLGWVVFGGVIWGAQVITAR